MTPPPALKTRASEQKKYFGSEAFSRFGDLHPHRRLALQNKKPTLDPHADRSAAQGIEIIWGNRAAPCRADDRSRSHSTVGWGYFAKIIVRIRTHDFRVLEAHFARKFGSKLLSERLPLGAGPVGPLLRPRTLRIRTALFRIRVNGIVSDPSERHCFGSE